MVGEEPVKQLIGGEARPMLMAALLLAGCSAPPARASESVRLKILYLGVDGGIRMYDEVVSRVDDPVTDAARQQDPVCAVRYSYTVHREPDGRYFVSL
jgi:hypothetical protein